MDDENEKLNELEETIGDPDDVEPTDDGDTTMPAGPEVGTDGDGDGNDDGNTDGNDDGNDDGDTTETESGPQASPMATDEEDGTLIKNFPLAETVNDDDDLIIETSLPQTEHVHADKLKDYILSAAVDMFYPLGSIYMSVNSTSPATLFGGTWEQITGSFLVGAGSGFNAGSTGGSQTVTLSTSNLPSHTHSLPSHTHSLPSHTHSIPSLSGTAASAGSHTHNVYASSFGVNASGSVSYLTVPFQNGGSSLSSIVVSSGAHTHSVTTNSSTSGSTSGTSGSTSGTSGSTGSGSSFSILPPYLAVYMWKRTA